MSPRPLAAKRRSRPYQGTRAARRVIAILKAFSPRRPTWALNDLAHHLDLNKTTVFRLLDALEREGMVSRDPEVGVFRLGPELITLASEALHTNDLYTATRAELESLAATTGETATLEILAGNDIIILDEARGKRLLGTRSEIGTRWPAYATSTGKVLLAAQSEADEESAGPIRFVAFTARTIRTKAALERELAGVRRRGFAIAAEEIEPGYVAIGVPLQNRKGRTVAAISLGGPKVRFTRERIRHLTEQLLAASERISKRM